MFKGGVGGGGVWIHSMDDSVQAIFLTMNSKSFFEYWRTIIEINEKILNILRLGCLELKFGCNTELFIHHSHYKRKSVGVILSPL